ncbi:MAG: phosphoglycerate kinase [Desulfobacterales bacterium]
MQKLTIEDLEVRGRRVLVRVDYNVPIKNSRVADDTRIRATLPTLERLLERGARLILMSHLGRPKGKPSPEFSLRPCAEVLASHLGRPVAFAADCVGPEAEAKAAALKNGEVLLLENLRFHPEEEANDPEFARRLSRLGELYVNDAFGAAHRAHASTEGVTRFFKQCAAGLLLKKELDYLGAALENPARPFVAVLGGAKISGKIDVISRLLPRVERLLVGGGMAFTFYKARGLEVGGSLVETERVELARRLLDEAGDKLLLPPDVVVTDRLDLKTGTLGALENVACGEIPPGWIGVDIGARSLERFGGVLKEAKTVLWNGPMGIFEIEAAARGTVAIARTLAEATARGATTIVGGGDSAAALERAGLAAKVTHVSTGGGASLEFLEGKVLPGVAALTDR